jgi:DnaJ-like protein
MGGDRMTEPLTAAQFERYLDSLTPSLREHLKPLWSNPYKTLEQRWEAMQVVMESVNDGLRSNEDVVAERRERLAKDPGFKIVTPLTPEERQALELLGCEREASAEDIKRAYLRAVQKYHPDHAGGSHDDFLKVRRAFELLTKREKENGTRKS